MARSLVAVKDAAGEKYLLPVRNVVSITEYPDANRLVEIKVREPITGQDGRICGYEINLYYSELNIYQFEGAYA